MNINQYFSFIERTPTAACYSDLREKVQRTGGQPVSFFTPHSGIQELLRKEAGKDRLLLGEPTLSIMDGDYVFDGSDDTGTRTQSRALSSEKQDARNRWIKIIQRLEKWHDGKARGILSNAISIIEDASQIPLHFTAALHSSAGSSAQAQEDQEQIENLRGLIGDLLKRVVETQRWAAEARDILFRKTFTGLLGDLVDGRSLVPLDRLSAVISEATSLPLNPREEEQMLQQIQTHARESTSFIKRLVSQTLEVSPLLLDCELHFHEALSISQHGLNLTAMSVSDPPGLGLLWFSPTLQLTAFELEDMLCHALQLPRKPRFVQLLYVVALPASALLDRPMLSVSSPFWPNVSVLSTLTDVFQLLENNSAYIVSDGDFSVSTSSNALSIANLQTELKCQLLTRHSGCRLLETLYLQGILYSAFRLEQTIDHVMNAFYIFSIPAKNKTDEQRRLRQQLSLHLVLQLALLVAQYPVQLPNAVPFLKHMRRMLNWKTRVCELDTENAPTNSSTVISEEQRRTSNRSKKQSGSGNKNIGSNINLMEIEALLKEGDTWPFQFSEEVSILQRRKEQALEWIARFKQLFSQKSIGSSRHRIVTEDASGDATIDSPDEPEQKATLSELRMLISHGGNLLGDGSGPGGGNSNVKKQAKSLQREMDKALSAVEEAEDWIDRFRSLITDFFSQPCFLALPQHMLDQQEPKVEADKTENEDEMNSDDARTQSVSEKLSNWEAVLLFEDAVDEQRAQLVTEISEFLSEAQMLPIVIEEAQVLNLQLQVLRWAISVRPLLLRQLHPQVQSSSNSPKRQRVKTAEFGQLRQDIARIRKELKGFSTFLEIPRMQEEELFQQCADEADLLTKRIKLLYSGRELKAKVSVEKVSEVISLAELSPVDFESELRIAKTALRQMEHWLSENRTILVRIGLAPAAVDEIPEKLMLEKDFAEDGPDSNKNENSEDVSLERLEQLAASVSHLALDFPIRRSVLLRVSQMRRWQRRGLFVQQTVQRLLSELNHHQQQFQTETGMNVKELTPFLSIQSLVDSAERVLQIGDSAEQTAAVPISQKGRGNNKEAFVPEDCTSPLPFPLSETSLKQLQVQAKNLSLSAKSSDLCGSIAQMLDILQQWRRESTEFCHGAISDALERHSQAHEQLLLLPLPVLELLLNSSTGALDAETQAAQMAQMLQQDPQLYFALQVAVFAFPFLQGLLPVNGSVEATSTLKYMDGALLKAAQQLQSLDLVRVVLALSRTVEEDSSLELEEEDSAVAESVGEGGAVIDAEENHIIRALSVVGGILRHLFIVRDTSTQMTSWADLNVSAVERLQCDTDSLIQLLREFAVEAADKKSEEVRRWGRHSALQLCLLHSQSQQLSKTSDEQMCSAEAIPNDQDEGDYGEDDEKPGEGEVIYEPKSTRLSQGIVKRKADIDFADSSKIHLHHPATALADPSPGHAAKKRKGNNAVVVKQEASEDYPKDSPSEVSTKPFPFSGHSLDARQLETRTLQWLLSAANHDGRDETNHGWALIQLCRQNETRTALQHLCSIDLLTALSHSAHLWRFVLQALTARLRETQKWQRELTQLYALKARDTAHHQRERLVAHLSLALSRGLFCQERFELAGKLQEADDWLCRARGMLAKDRSFYGDLDNLKVFIKQGETLLLDATTELTALKSELRRARQWKSRCDAFQATDSNARSQEELAQLTKDAETICVDLRSDLDAISVDSRTYCLCRQFYFGDMIGCDNCDEWYHYSCANLSANQVAKCEHYTCVRCAMKSSLAVGASVARQICAKWQNAELHFEERMNQIYKINRRILRLQDEKEKAKLQHLQQQPMQQTAPAAQAAEASSIPFSTAESMDVDEHLRHEEGQSSATISVPAPTTVVSNAGAATKGRVVKPVDLNGVLEELDRLYIERQQLATQIQLEEETKTVISAWMADVLRLIAPQSEAELETSLATAQPLNPLNSAWQQTCVMTDSCNSASSLVSKPHAEVMTVLQSQLQVMLPPAALQLQHNAAESGILSVDDVQIVIDAFRWMTWCHLGLFLLRFPPPTPLLRRFLAARPAKLCDDKILRHLQGVLGKAAIWKGKARKTSASTRKIDDAKLRAMVLEANNLPFSSRMKTHYQLSLWRFDNSSSGMQLSDFVRQMEGSACDSSEEEQGTDIFATDESTSAPVGSKRKCRGAYILAFPHDADIKLAQIPQVSWPVFGPFSAITQNTSSSNAAATQFLQQQLPTPPSLS
jgi:hypothetical protein